MAKQAHPLTGAALIKEVKYSCKLTEENQKTCLSAQSRRWKDWKYRFISTLSG
ncbi:MAG: hypothetical protein HC769_19890 [Cyanobacteria bacterium CRU_2_1]|nr:hypothetical protein [Cyanobacteria bacterium CRU_2_1]